MYAFRFLLFLFRPIVFVMGRLLRPVASRLANDEKYAARHYRMAAVVTMFIDFVEALNTLWSSVMMNADFDYWLYGQWTNTSATPHGNGMRACASGRGRSKNRTTPFNRCSIYWDGRVLRLT